MKTRLAPLLALALLGPGCLAEEADEADEIASALEDDNGGLTMDDELPMFGADDDFAAAALGDQVEYVDPMEQDESVAVMMDGPDAVVARVQLLWGQLPPDGQPDLRNWSGRISINRGALLVRRTIAFDPVTDRILQRTDAQQVDFTSVTAPHVDGLVLVIVDPQPDSSEPLTLSYASIADGEVYTATLGALLAGPVVADLGDGNRMAGVALARPIDACDHGFLRGRWRAVAPGRGVFMGGVADGEGAPIGHVRGLYGRRLNGEQVFFGKYIDLDGHFRGIFGGHYQDGDFRGRWLTRAGEHGVLGGEYRETSPGPHPAGHFAGRWAETSCAQDLPAE